MFNPVWILFNFIGLTLVFNLRLFFVCIDPYREGLTGLGPLFETGALPLLIFIASLYFLFSERNCFPVRFAVFFVWVASIVSFMVSLMFANGDEMLTLRYFYLSWAVQIGILAVCRGIAFDRRKVRGKTG